MYCVLTLLPDANCSRETDRVLKVKPKPLTGVFFTVNMGTNEIKTQNDGMCPG